ncbi:MAG: hypothetical protein EBQ98_02670 [Actinobacteria bacterium]|nr:hypothetical protein [Actinomycetota bacterium]
MAKSSIVRCSVKTIEKVVGVLVFCSVVLGLPACSVFEIEPPDYSETEDMQLCMEWMNSPSVNSYQPYRESEIKRRRLNCWKYGNVREARERADASVRQSLDELREIGEALMKRPQQQGPTTTTYILNGKTVTCTTLANGKVVSCN